MALADNALVSLADTKTYLGVSGSSDDSLLERLINSQSTRIEAYCDRKFRKGTYRESYNGNRQLRLRLRNFPVKKITRLAIGNRLAFTVNADNTTDLRNVVEVQEDRVLLTRHDSAGSSTQTTLTFASKPTASDLVTSISATTGFTATLGTNCLSEDLFPAGGVNCLLSSAQFYFPERDDLQYRLHHDRATLEFVDVSDMVFFGKRTDAGLPFPQTFAGIRVDYEAGYDGLTEIPADLAQACIKLVQYAYNDRSQNTTMASESIGSYTYTRSQDPLITDGDLVKLLAQYVDRKS
jgi:hypothetical protein